MHLTTHQSLVAGTDSVAADGNALVWAPTGSNIHWPDLAGATLTLIVGHNDENVYGNLPLTWTGTVPSSPDNPTSVSLDVTAAQSANLPADEYDYLLSAVPTNGTKFPLALGKLTVEAAPGAIPPFPPVA